MVDRLMELDHRLHGYQIRAVTHLWQHDRAGLFLEMGMGKSASVLSALTPDHLPALVVGPKRVAEHTWPEEIAKWRPDLSYAVAAGTPAARKAALQAGADITMIGVANLKDVKPDWSTIVLDELSLFKNSSSARFKLAKGLTRFTDHVWGLTGTPTPNGLIDLWSELFLLDHGARLGAGKRYGTGIEQYRQRWFVKENPYFEHSRLIPRDQAAVDEIQELISDICMSMRAEDYLSLPPVTYNTVEVFLPDKAMKAYRQMKADLIAELDDGIVTAATAAVMQNKLSQITAGFMYHDMDKTVEQVHAEKIDAVEEIVEGTGSPVLVFYRYQAELEALKKKLPQARTVDEKGVLDAWNQGEVPVLLAHPASAGHGLNLAAGGHTIVWATLQFSSEWWQQANARLARQGQTKPVMVHVLEVPNSIDGYTRAVVEGKISVQNGLMAYLSA